MTESNSRKPDIRLIVLDVDGTLLDSHHALTARNEEVIKAAIAKGIPVVLATGKTRYATLQLIERLGLKSPGIYLQGLVTYDADGQVMHQQLLDPTLARKVITFGEDRGFTMFAYSGEHILARSFNQEFVDGMAVYHEIAPEVVGALQNQVGQRPIHKLIAIGDPRAIKALRWQLSMQIGGAGRLMQAGVPRMVEVLPPGSSKGAALRLLLKDLKIAPENVMAVGDAENDIEMIELAGVGVAMGQAAQNVRDAADTVTGTCDQDGVAQAIERYVLSEAETEAAESKAETEPPEVVIEPVEPEETEA